jgi:hypothetical protein
MPVKDRFSYWNRHFSPKLADWFYDKPNLVFSLYSRLCSYCQSGWGVSACSPTYIAKVENLWSSMSIPPYIFVASYLMKSGDYFSSF